MNNAEQLSYSMSNENYAYSEINIGKFNDFARKYIFFDHDTDNDKYYLIKSNARFNSIILPEELSENFIYYKNFAKFFVLDTKFSKIMHRIYNINLQKMARTNPQKLIYEYYYKWVFADSNKDNRYFAMSVLKQVKESRKNALNLMLQGSILANDKNLLNIQKSLESFDEAEQLLSLKNFDVSDISEVRYFINLFKGFVQLLDQNYEGAKYEFLQALSQKAEGITAKFHLAVSEIHLSDIDLAKSLANEVIDFDLKRTQSSIDANSFNDFNYFVRNFISSNYFDDPICYSLLEVFENRVNDLSSSAQVRFLSLKEDILSIKEIKFGEMHEEAIYKSLDFIEEFVKNYQNSENILVLENISKVEEKLVSTLTNILNNIEQSYKLEIEESLKIYDLKIGENAQLKARHQSEYELQKKRIEDRLKTTINDYQLMMDEKIKAIEFKSENLELKPEYNPSASFRNSISYSLFLSLLVLLLAGFAEYSNSSVQEVMDASKVITIVLFHGSKWGVISFIIGIFISLMVSASTSMEKASVKQRLSKTVTLLKNEKAENIKQIKEDFDRAIKDNEQKYKNRIEAIDEQVRELIEKKKQDESVMIERAASRVSKETGRLKEIIEHYQ
jgi:hypothetical protein